VLPVRRPPRPVGARLPEAQLSDRGGIEVPEPPADDGAVARLLATGDVDVKGRMPWSSNGTFLVEVGACDGDARCLAIYKPQRGERPLWDFPAGLWRREVAAYRMSAFLGLDLVPVTVPRADAPFGEGSLQVFVPFDPEVHYFTLYEDEARHDDLRRLCVFDLVINSCDRKGGHCILARDGKVLAIDNGLSFHAEPKLRTVIWEFGGDSMRDDEVAPLERLLDEGVPDDVAVLLDAEERDALLARTRNVTTVRRFPIDTTGRRYPWPLV
jgi:uncharacterized repeat protein (TIGR03843 family)